MKNQITELNARIKKLEDENRQLRDATFGCGAGFREDDVLADGWDFGSWERGFDDAAKAIENRMRAI